MINARKDSYNMKINLTLTEMKSIDWEKIAKEKRRHASLIRQWFRDDLFIGSNPKNIRKISDKKFAIQPVSALPGSHLRSYLITIHFNT